MQEDIREMSLNLNKRYPIIFNTLLFLWFMLDMTGFQIGGKILVGQSWKDDGIFMLLFVIAFAAFVFIEKVGKYILSSWLFMWFIVQFFSHWSFTIANFGIGSNKIEYYEGTIKIINTTDIYVPDLYHTVEHILILVSLITVIIFCVYSTKKKKIKR